MSIPRAMALICLQLLTAISPTPTPAPSTIHGRIIQPGSCYDEAAHQIRPCTTPTKVPRPLANSIGTCRNPEGWAEGTVTYLGCEIEVVIGRVKDIDTRASLNVLLLIEVEEAFPMDPGPIALVDMSSLDLRAGGRPVTKGEKVLVTLIRRPADYHWGCGRLRPCNGPPPEVNWVGVELFKPANWP
jgi:hypothetical protein